MMRPLLTLCYKGQSNSMMHDNYSGLSGPFLPRTACSSLNPRIRLSEHSVSYKLFHHFHLPWEVICKHFGHRHSFVPSPNTNPGTRVCTDDSKMYVEGLLYISRISETDRNSTTRNILLRNGFSRHKRFFSSCRSTRQAWHISWCRCLLDYLFHSHSNESPCIVLGFLYRLFLLYNLLYLMLCIVCRKAELALKRS